jgi:hypothetical protein
MKAAPITDRKAERPKNFGLYQKLDPFFFSEISSAQTTSLSAAAPSLHRFLAHIPEPQIRVPNSDHLPLIAGISSFSWLPFFLFPHSLSLLLLRQYRRVSTRLSLFLYYYKSQLEVAKAVQY